MEKCNFEWSMCQTCASAGSNLCPLENNRTIQELKDEIENLEARIAELEEEIEGLKMKKQAPFFKELVGNTKSILAKAVKGELVKK